MTITRRSFLAGLGSVSVGLLFRARLNAVLDSLERDLVEDPVVAGQLPSAAVITVRAQGAFRPRRIVVPDPIASQFMIEDVQVGDLSQLSGAVPADLFRASSHVPDLLMTSAGPEVEIRFRVRYVGGDPAGARFQCAMIGDVIDHDHATRGRTMRTVIPIDSESAIVA